MRLMSQGHTQAFKPYILPIRHVTNEWASHLSVLTSLISGRLFHDGLLTRFCTLLEAVASCTNLDQLIKVREGTS